MRLIYSKSSKFLLPFFFALVSLQGDLHAQQALPKYAPVLLNCYPYEFSRDEALRYMLNGDTDDVEIVKKLKGYQLGREAAEAAVKDARTYFSRGRPEGKPTLVWQAEAEASWLTQCVAKQGTDAIRPLVVLACSDAGFLARIAYEGRNDPEVAPLVRDRAQSDGLFKDILTAAEEWQEAGFKFRRMIVVQCLERFNK